LQSKGYQLPIQAVITACSIVNQIDAVYSNIKSYYYATHIRLAPLNSLIGGDPW